MDQRQANRDAKRAALFLLPVTAPMPADVDEADARRLREGWERMRSQLEREAQAQAPTALAQDPDQIAAWSLADLVGPLCPEHQAPVAQVKWGPLVGGLPDRWRAVRFACGCEREPDALPSSAWGPDAAPGECCAGQRLGGEHYPDCPVILGPR